MNTYGFQTHRQLEGAANGVERLRSRRERRAEGSERRLDPNYMPRSAHNPCSPTLPSLFFFFFFAKAFFFIFFFTLCSSAEVFGRRDAPFHLYRAYIANFTTWLQILLCRGRKRQTTNTAHIASYTSYTQDAATFCCGRA